MTKMITRDYTQSATRSAVEASWQESFGINELGRKVSVLTTSDISSNVVVSPGSTLIQHAVLARPMVARATDNSPRMSITFMLNRKPTPDESELEPLVEGAVVGIDATVSPSTNLLESLSSNDVEYRPLFPHQVTFRLLDGAIPLAETSVNNGQTTASISATLDRPTALQLMAALNQEASSLVLRATLEYRMPGAIANSLRFSLDLAEVYEFLAQKIESDRVLQEVDLQNYFTSMLDGIVRLEDMAADSAIGIEEVANKAFPKFLRAVSILFDRNSEDSISGEAKQYLLSPNRPPSMTVRFSLRPSELEVTNKLALSVTMPQLLKEALYNRNWESLVHFVVFDEKGKVLPLPRHTRTKARESFDRTNALAVVDNSVISLSQAIRPVALNPVVSHSILANQPLQDRLPILALENLAITAASQRPRHLPIVRDRRELLWRDRIDANRYWYGSEFTVVVPEATAQADSSPFLFSFRRTGHDLHGRPALEGTIRLTLRPTMPESVRNKLTELGSVRAQAVPTKNLSAALRIPFRDEAGKARRETCRAASIEQKRGYFVATFHLANDWVRLCYGALAYADFQSESLDVAIGYSFDAYIPTEDRRLELLFGGKSLRLPLAKTAKQKKQFRDRSYIDAANGTVHMPEAELRLLPRKTKQRRPTATAVTATNLLPSVHAVSLPIVRPDLQVVSPVVNMLKLEKYALNTQVRRASTEVFFPCNEFGRLYVEERAEGDRVLGCQEAFKLGETQYRLYEELPLERSNYRVYRSLQIPGRFVVVPQIYAIGRFGANEGDKAYRPSALLYSTIDDLDDLRSSRCVIMATLQPDLPLFERIWLLDELRQYHPNPILDYFTELEGNVTCDWVLPDSNFLRLEAKATRLSGSFEVSLITDAIGVPQLQEIMKESGIKGVATLLLPDGSKFRTTLNLQLSHIVGPWKGGPLEITNDRDNQLKLKNRIESAVNVSEILIPQNGSADSFSLATRIEPDREISTAVSAEAAAIVPVYSLEALPLNLTEIRSFIEDIAVNVLLVNRLDFDALDLQELEIVAKIQGLTGTAVAKFTPSSSTVASLEFLLPLTVFYADPVVEFQAKVTDRSDRQQQMTLTPLRLGTGIIVKVTPELLGL